MTLQAITPIAIATLKKSIARQHQRLELISPAFVTTGQDGLRQSIRLLRLFDYCNDWHESD